MEHAGNRQLSRAERHTRRHQCGSREAEARKPGGSGAGTLACYKPQVCRLGLESNTRQRSLITAWSEVGAF